MANTLAGAATDPAFAAEALSLPGEGFLADQMEIADPVAIHAVRAAPARPRSAARCGAALRATYDALADAGPYRIDGTAIGRRALRNACLAYLAAAGDGAALAKAQFDAATNMTDASPRCRCWRTPTARRATRRSPPSMPAGAATTWCWTSGSPSRPWRRGRMRIAAVRALYAHPDFDLKNPNRARVADRRLRQRQPGRGSTTLRGRATASSPMR